MCSWNSVVSSVDYFSVVYPDVRMEFYLPAAYVYPQLPLLALMVKVRGRHVRCSIAIA